MFPPTLQSVASVPGPMTIVQRQVVSCAAIPASRQGSSGDGSHRLSPVSSCNLHGPGARQARDEIGADQRGRRVGTARHVMGQQMLHTANAPVTVRL